MKKLNIVYVSRFTPGSRIGHAYKYYTLLQSHFGGQIIKGVSKEWRPQIEEMIRAGQKPDLLFVSGYQSDAYEVPLALRIPYILTISDMASLRTDDVVKRRRLWELEKAAIQKAGGVLFNSEFIMQYCQQRIKNMPPAETIHLRPLREDLNFSPLLKLKGKHLVYAGGLKAKWSQRKNKAGYRAYHEIFKAFICADWTVHVYTIPAMQPRLKHYQKLGCVVHQYVPEGKELYRELSQYTAGLQGYNIQGIPQSSLNYMYMSMPNKLWEYLAAGIPTIGVNPGSGGQIYHKRWGLALEEGDLERNRLEQVLQHLPKITDELRYKETMEQDLGKFERLIEGALKR